MPHATCSVCKHPELEAIEAALNGAASVRVVAGRFGLKKSSIDRHRHHGAPKKPSNTGDVSKIDVEIRKLRAAQKRAERRRDNALSLQIAKELRSWFTLRVKAEALEGTRQTAQTAEVTAIEALAMAQTLIEASLDDAEVRAWLHTLAERVPVAEAVTEEA